MADILIRGMDKPYNCFHCDLSYLRGERLFCCVTKDEVLRSKIASDCPIQELPEHGDLIDMDAFRAENEYYLNREFINPKYEDTLDDLLKDAPVIVPASKEETE